MRNLAISPRSCWPGSPHEVDGAELPDVLRSDRCPGRRLCGLVGLPRSGRPMRLLPSDARRPAPCGTGCGRHWPAWRSPPSSPAAGDGDLRRLAFPAGVPAQPSRQSRGHADRLGHRDAVCGARQSRRCPSGSTGRFSTSWAGPDRHGRDCAMVFRALAGRCGG